MVLQESEICESMHKEISFITNNIIFEKHTAMPVSYVEPNGKNRPYETCSLPYDAAANIHKQKLCSFGKIVQKKPGASLVDR